MGTFAAVRSGLDRARRAPAVVFGTLALTLFVSIPLAIALRGMLEAHLGASLAADSALRGANYEWWQEFQAQATGLGTTFLPSIIGFGAVLLNISSLLDNLPLATTIAGATAAWLVLWSFLAGGVLDRLARNRPTRARGFFGACGAHAGGLIRLGLIALAVYAALFAWLHPLLFDRLLARATHETTVERTAFFARVGMYALFGLLLLLVNLVIDYARVRLVVEDRRSAIGAVIASIRFVRANAGAAAGVYLVNALLFLVLLALYALAAPGASAPGLLILLAGEVYILARHYLKLAFYGSEAALFQARLAHAGYTAGPPLVWPESPAAEAILNASPEPLRGETPVSTR